MRKKRALIKGLWIFFPGEQLREKTAPEVRTSGAVIYGYSIRLFLINLRPQNTPRTHSRS